MQWLKRIYRQAARIMALFLPPIVFDLLHPLHKRILLKYFSGESRYAPEMLNAQAPEIFNIHANLTADKDAIYLVYGNHGHAPDQISDFWNYYSLCIRKWKLNVKCSYELVPGSVNILLENFSEAYGLLLKRFCQEDGRVVIIAPETLTGETFNHFYPMGFEHHQNHASDYDRIEIMKKRFETFDQVAPFAEQIWVCTNHHLPVYSERYGAKVKYIPFRYVEGFGNENICLSEEQRDIDCIFSGGLTSHRMDRINLIRSAGLKIVILPSVTPSFIRMDFCHRSKIILHLKQNEAWKNPSGLRNMHAICNGLFLITEKCEYPSEQDPYISIVPQDALVERIQAAIENKSYLNQPRENLNKFKGEVQGHLFFKEPLTDNY
jgi:hypothetical protein